MSPKDAGNPDENLKYRRLLKSLTDAVVTVNPDGFVMEADDLARKIQVVVEEK